MSSPLRIAHVTFSGKGGAGIAARRISNALNQFGHQSDFIVAQDPPAGGRQAPRKAMQQVSSKLGRAALRLYPCRTSTIWTNNTAPGTMPDWFAAGGYDIINLHWMGEGFLPVPLLARAARPVVWTMHDMWPFTGGCHYVDSCTRWLDRCGACPELGSTLELDLSRFNWKLKSNAYRVAPIFLASPSEWLADAARASSALSHRPVRVIRNTVDLQLFRPRDRIEARREFGLPDDGRLVLIGAPPSPIPSRKGSQFVQPFIDLVRRKLSDTPVTFLVFGTTPIEEGIVGIGHISDERRMATLYAAVDLYLLPTIQDNLPNTVAEAAAAGTPTAAFSVGGVPEMIRHGDTGILAPTFDIIELASASAALLKDASHLSRMGAASRAFAEANFAADIVAADYLAYYHAILSGSVTQEPFREC